MSYVDPAAIAEVTLAMVIGIVPVLYFRRDGILFAIAALAYFIAIVAKIVVEQSFAAFFAQKEIAAYISYGALTAVFEIGFAYAFVHSYRGGYRPDKGWAYGAYLAFFENTVFIGVLGIFSLLALSLLGNSPQGQNTPLPAELLTVTSSAFERITSFIAHAVWGYMVFYAAMKKKPFQVLLAVPLAFIDSAAAWWDSTHAIGYPLLVLILLSFVVLFSFLSLYFSGMLDEAIAGLSRKGKIAIDSMEGTAEPATGENKR